MSALGVRSHLHCVRCEAAAATESLQFIFWGAIVTLPAILGYTAYVHRVFSGKATELSYE